MTKQKFLRRVSKQFSKLGRKRKKKQTWRRPTGRDNKMREKRNGRPAIVSVGFRTDKKAANKIRDKTPVMILNINDLNKITEGRIGIVGNVGTMKKIEIAQKAQEMKVLLHNVNPKIFLKKNKIKKKEKKETEKKTKENKK